MVFLGGGWWGVAGIEPTKMLRATCGRCPSFCLDVFHSSSFPPISWIWIVDEQKSPNITSRIDRVGAHDRPSHPGTGARVYAAYARLELGTFLRNMRSFLLVFVSIAPHLVDFAVLDQTRAKISPALKIDFFQFFSKGGTTWFFQGGRPPTPPVLHQSVSCVICRHFCSFLFQLLSNGSIWG